MKKAHECQQYAERCRVLLESARPEHRAALIQMAETWEIMAREREAQVARQRRIAVLNEKIKQYEMLSAR